MLQRLRRKAQKLVWLEFQSHDRAPRLNLEISPEELQLELAKIPAPLFLGRYSKEEIRTKFERCQILPELRSAGFDPLILEVESDGLVEHRVLVHTGERNYDRVLLELRLREGVFKVKDTIARINPQLHKLFQAETIPMLWIDWLLLQNPFARFPDRKPPLPEQKYPGLGILNLVVPLIGEFASETRKHAVLDIPEHFHGALFYSRWMRFFNPEMEGKMKAILRDLKNFSLAAISWGVLLDGLFNRSLGRFEDWKPGEQIYPLSINLEHYFDSPIYRELAEKALAENHYSLDLEKISAKMKFLEPMEAEAVKAALEIAENG
jgi:hypothetical protein